MQVASGAGQLAYAGLSIYCASKWGIEGFIESMAQEVAPFGIEATIFEPGAIRTDFGISGALAPAMAEYEENPASMMRNGVRHLKEAGPGASTAPGDPVKMAQTMIDSLAQSPAPKRVVMGSDVYVWLMAAYRERAAALEAQKAVAFGTDF